MSGLVSMASGEVVFRMRNIRGLNRVVVLGVGLREIGRITGLIGRFGIRLSVRWYFCDFG